MSAATGSCLCGNIKVTIVGEPVKNILCHCTDCHKITGSHFSDNAQVLDKNFTLVSGTPKQFTKTADSGSEITSHFCGDCGTTLWRSGIFFPGGKIVKSGIMDDPKWQGEQRPVGELFAESKTAWLPELVKA
ncbi:hypothetical protein ACLOAV_010781 [Pseudogymnoascus australis]